jgi:hypothetical protein
MKALEKLKQLKIKAHGKPIHKYFESEFNVKPPKSASQLENLIDQYCTLMGAECTRIYSGGRQMVSKTNVTDVLGRSNSITDSKFIPGTTRAGTSDLIIGKDGRILYPEVKFSKSDRQRPAQKEFQKRVESFGCKYVIVRTLDEFIEEFERYYL